MQRQGFGGQGHVQHVLGRALQRLGEARRVEQRGVEQRRPSVDQSPHHRFEQHLLATEAVIEGALRDAGPLCHRLDAGRAEAVAEKQHRRDIEDAVGQLRRFETRRPAAVPARLIPPVWFLFQRHRARA